MHELTDEQKLREAHAAFQEFSDQFGENDIIKEAFFDLLLEAIFNEEPTNGVSIPSETGQGRNQDSEYLGAGGMPCYEIE